MNSVSYYEFRSNVQTKPYAASSIRHDFIKLYRIVHVIQSLYSQTLKSPCRIDKNFCCRRTSSGDAPRGWKLVIQQDTADLFYNFSDS